MKNSTLNLKNVATFVACFVACMMLISGCKKEPEIKNKPGMQSVVLKGIVYNSEGKALSGVKVTTGSASATTHSDGTFSFSEAQVVNKRAVIKFEKNGYFSLTRSGVKANEMFIEAVLYPKGNSDISLETTFETSEAKTLEVDAGMKVKLKAQSIMRADGTPYNGTVKADMLYLDPNNENFTGMMPGGDLAAIREDNSEVMLISWGMTNVNLTDGGGNPLQLKEDAPAEVIYPVPAGMRNNPPATIPLWHFDEVKGIWIEDGIATLKDGVYVGNVTHFSWSNLDEPAKRVTITGRVVCENGKPVPYVKVNAGQTATNTNSNGNYTVFVPENYPCNVSVTVNGESFSRFVQGQPGGTVVTGIDFIVPCEDEGEGEPEIGNDTDKASIKYLQQGINVIITFDNGGKLFRFDQLNPDGEHYLIIVNQNNKTVYQCYDEENWEDYSDNYDSYLSLVQGYMFICKANSYPYQMWTKLPNRNIAGKSCNVYNFSYGDEGITIATWNGLTMLLESSEVTSYVAEAVTLNVPARAFTKQVNIDWLP